MSRGPEDKGLERPGTQGAQIGQGVKKPRRTRGPDGPADPKNPWMPIYHNPRLTNHTQSSPSFKITEHIHMHLDLDLLCQ